MFLLTSFNVKGQKFDPDVEDVVKPRILICSIKYPDSCRSTVKNTAPKKTTPQKSKKKAGLTGSTCLKNDPKNEL